MCSWVDKWAPISAGKSNMYIRSLGIPHRDAASTATRRRGRQVKSAFTLEDLSWYSSSVAEYAAFAGDTIPDNE